MTLAASSWWDDWLKFVPGWLAFLWAVGTALRKLWLRRHKTALGPDDEAVREALTTARTLFTDIIAKGGFHSKWFQAEERRDTGQRLRDLAARRDDEELRTAMTSVAKSWDDAFANSPPPRALVAWTGAPQDPRDRKMRQEDTKTRARQVESAREGIKCVEIALKRLNKLEHRIFGRS
ncbi:hypothetical protein [Streptomyces sp. YU58]|uniref:hypothetical protein n=1 Tax=Streptomyces sp. SX92 TaxID=3158972 RepID=UPI0027B9C282|nr:hypothetical protein [Streptomyces coralus]WLW55571.1 hypothetical protein QU709_31440 [Streptomyces coralus]